MSVFGPISCLAARQHGTVTRQQLAELAYSDSQVRALLSSGVLVRVAPGVYLIAGSVPNWRRDLRVALHRAGPGAVVSHRSAAALWELDRFRPGHLDLVAPWARARTGTDVTIHRSTDLPARDITAVDGLPITTPTRTLLDMGRFVPAARLGSMMDDAVRRNLTSFEALHSRLAELSRPGRKGLSPARSALADRPGGSTPAGSPFETRVRRLLISAGIPEPVLQHRVCCGEITYPLDLAWPELLVAVECDGFRFHRTPDQLEWDDRRRTALGRLGWLLHHVTWRQYRDDPENLVREVRWSLSLRSV